jgi:putative GTP pyrophosphokinase
MHDAVAGRVVVYFLSNLPLIDREIRESEAVEICPDEPPIAYLGQDLAQRLGLGHMRRGTKDSGYASLHYILRFRQSSVPSEQRPWFEIQVRTLAEDLWGEIEHVLGYKPEKRTSFAVRRQFQIIGSQLTAIDEHFNLLFEELSRFQEEVTFADTNPLNAENLPPVLSELGIGCAQKEIDGLLKLLASRGSRTVGDLRDGGSPRRLEIIRNTYRNSEGRPPSNFELVAGIAAMRGLTDEHDMVAALRAQIDFLNAWEKLKPDVT